MAVPWAVSGDGKGDQMKLAVVGKGGVGKTSISGTLARLLARRGHDVLAIDGDPNPNLALALGVTPAEMAAMPGLTSDLLEQTPTGWRLTKSLDQLRDEYAIPAPDDVSLLAVRPPKTAGTGCLGAQHATVRNVVHVAAEAPGDICLLDIEASLEHFRQNKAIEADTMLVVVEPYFKSLETGRRMIRLGKQLKPKRLVLVANKVWDKRSRDAVERLADEEDVEVAGAVPHDVRMLEADLACSALLDYDGEAPSVEAIHALADELLTKDAATTPAP